MNKISDSKSSGRQPTPPPATLVNSLSPDEQYSENKLLEELYDSNEQLSARCTELIAANELLISQLESSEQARILAEARVLHLSTAVEEGAQDLQLFGSNYFVPMSVTSITRDSTGVAMNGIPLGSPASDEADDPVAEHMLMLARNVNAQKAAFRAKAAL